MPQQYHNKIPLASNCLQLGFEFDTSGIVNWSSLFQKDHQVACDEGCEASKTKIDSSKVICLSRLKVGPVSLKDCHVLPYFDDPSHPIRIEFLYSSNNPQLAIRVLCDLSIFDGVSAARIALSTLEMLEYGKSIGPTATTTEYGKSIGSTEAFKMNPPFRFGLRHVFNFINVIGSGHISSIYPFSNSVNLKEAAAPTSGDGLRAYFAAENPQPAILQWYSTTGPANSNFIVLLEVMQQWMDRVKWLGFLSLINFPPGVSASIVTHSEDLVSIEKRYDGIYVPIAQPPATEAWIVANYVHVKYMFFNNYGRHTMKSNAIATAFTWDWLGMAAPICGVGCIAINDKLLVWTRWTQSGIKESEEFFRKLGNPIGSTFQTPVTW